MKMKRKIKLKASITTNLFYALVFFNLSSCSYFIRTYESQVNKQYSLKKNIKSNICEIKKPIFEIYTETPNLSEEYPKWVGKRSDFTPIENFVILTLIQMRSSPHVFSPTAAFDIIIKNGNNTKLYSFNNETISSPYPLIMGLKYLLAIYPSNNRLQDLTRIIDRDIKFKVPISRSFFQYLSRNIKNLDKKIKDNYFLRGGEVIKMSESIQYRVLRNFISKLDNPNSKIFIAKEKFNQKYPINFGPNKNQGFCNKDLKKYEQSIYPEESMSNSQHFGLSYGKFHAHGVVNQNPGVKTIGKSPFISNQSKTKSTPICVVGATRNFKSMGTDPEFWFFSSQSRDPAQHLYHLLQYKVREINSLKNLSTLSNYSRHLFLQKPPRLLYESKRGSKNQMEQLLKLDFPIYHQNTLGKITASFNSQRQHRFLIDTRHEMEINCR